MNDKPIEILLVEDNPGDARLLRESLAEVDATQFKLTHVERLSDALKRLDEERFDLILLDLFLPDGNGLDIFRQAHAQVPGLPVVILTGLYVEEQFALQAMREGAQDYLVKDHVDGEVLVRAMRYAIERKRAEQRLFQLYEQLKKQAEELEKARRIEADFTAMLVHNLRSPLATVMSRAGILEDGVVGPVNTEQRKWLVKIETGAGRVLDLIDNFLDLSKIDASRIELVKEEVGLKQLVRNK